jgi:hypothetical protein
MSEPKVNPYESSREEPFALAQSNKLDLVFFLINFVSCLAFIFLSAVAIVGSIFGSGSPYEFFGALIFMGPAILFAIGEWLLFVRRWEGLSRPLGVICGVIAAFWTFGLVADVFEALFGQRRPDRPYQPDMMWFWLIFGAFCVTISAYNTVCCWHRFHYRRSPLSCDSGDIK